MLITLSLTLSLTPTPTPTLTLTLTQGLLYVGNVLYKSKEDADKPRTVRICLVLCAIVPLILANGPLLKVFT